MIDNDKYRKNAELSKAIVKKFFELRILDERYHSNFPKRTETLSERGIRIVLNYLRENIDSLMMLYGSFPLMAQLHPKYNRVPGDIDIQLKVGKRDAEIFSDKLFQLLRESGENIRKNPNNPIIIDSFVDGEWKRAVDIHHTEEEPEDSLSPLYPVEHALNNPFRDRKKVLNDVIDTYCIMSTAVEIGKTSDVDEEKIKKAEELIRKWKKLYGEWVDFDKRVVIKLE